MIDNVTTITVLGAATLLLAVFFCTVELCVLLVHRLRLKVLEEAGDARATRLNRFLEKQDLAATSANIGVHFSIAALATLSWLLGTYSDASTGARVAIAATTVSLLVLLVTLLPRIVVPARPTRTLLILSLPFALSCWLFSPLSRLLLALRGRFASGDTGDSPPLASRSSLVLREDLRKLISRPELAILGEREAEMALKLFRFGGTLVRDLLTPLSSVTALEVGATVADLFDAVRGAGFTRIPIYREAKENLIGVVNVHDALDAPLDHKLDGFVRSAPRVPPNSLAHSLFVYLQENPDWMAFVESDGLCEGIVTVEDLVEEVLGEIYDEFELPRPRYVPSGRHRLRVSATLSLRELGRDLQLSRSDFADTPIAEAIGQKLGRVPVEDESVEIDGVRVWVTRVVDDEAVEVEVGRHG